MTRAFLIALAVSSAAAAQQPPPLPLPSDPAAVTPSKPDAKPAEKKKKPMQTAPLSLDAAPATKQKPGTMPLFGGTAPAPAAKASTTPVPATPAASTSSSPAPAAAASIAPAPAPLSASAPAPAATSTLTVTVPPPSITPTPRAVPASAVTGRASLAPTGAVVMSPAPMADLRLRPDTGERLWTVRGFIGGERSTESDYTDAASDYHFGGEVTRWFQGNWLARGELDWRNSTQGYVPLHSSGGTSQQVFVDENRFDVTADVGYDFGPRLLDDGRLELTPMLGLQYMAIRNGAFPSDLIGPNLGARAKFALSSALNLHATVAYTYNLAVASTQNSALKAPVGDFASRAGIGLPLTGGYELELDYSGDVLGFQNTFRVAHGAALGFGTSF